MKENLWPAEFLAAGLAPDHCADVLAGSYDVPFNPAMPPVILDIGANVGAFARWASLRWPGCSLYCYEPHPVNFDLLVRSLKRLIGCKGHAVRNAVADSVGAARLKIAFTNCGAHSLYNLGEQSAESLAVETIDAAVLPTADILKIDAEGAEMMILSRMAAVDRLRGLSAIVLEYHFAEDLTEIPDLLAQHGFKQIAHRAITPTRGELKFMKS